MRYGNGTLDLGREPDEETLPHRRPGQRSRQHLLPRAALEQLPAQEAARHQTQFAIMSCPNRISRAAVNHRTGAVTGAPLGDHTIRRRHSMCLASVQIQQALRYVGVAAVVGDHDQLVDQMVDMSSFPCAQLIYIAHLATVAPRIPVPMSVYSCRDQASLYITLAKRASQR